MPWDKIYQLYQELQSYVGWTEDDARRVASVAGLVEPHVVGLIDDFYEQIDRHPDARKIITGGPEQVARLKETLRGWLRDLLGGQYDKEHVSRRWHVGVRHVEIGLSQVFANVALGRLRRGLLATLERVWTGDRRELLATCSSLNLLLDLDLAIIEDAYQTEFSKRQQRSARLAAIGQVAGGVAHELRNPLNVVKTSVYYLLNTRKLSPLKLQEHLQRMERHIGASDGVVAALSEFARLPEPELHPLSIKASVKEVLDSIALPEEIAVSIDCSSTLPAALADARQLRIVFSNLVRNARDAMPQGGVLTIRGESIDGDVVVTIADTGVGISHESLEEVSEPLYPTKGSGIGLGLAIARSIIDKHGGQLQIASEVGAGSRFIVRLAAASDRRA